MHCTGHSPHLLSLPSQFTSLYLPLSFSLSILYLSWFIVCSNPATSSTSPPASIVSIPLLSSVGLLPQGTVPTLSQSLSPAVATVMSTGLPCRCLSPTKSYSPVFIVLFVSSSPWKTGIENSISTVHRYERAVTWYHWASDVTSSSSGYPSITQTYSINFVMSCFAVYVAVLSESHSHLVQSCLAYKCLIIREVRRADGDGWVLYDTVFRQNATQDNTTNSSTFLSTRWTNTTFFCLLCFELDHNHMKLCTSSSNVWRW